MSEAIFELRAQPRSDVGKGASRRLRRDAKVPAIIYGGEQAPSKITLSAHEVAKALQHEAFFSHILTIDVAGNAEKVIIKDLQRHPAREIIYHMDFLRVNADQAIQMQVPLHYLGEQDAPGVKAGGIVSRDITEIEVSCLPTDLPEFIEVDISQLDLNAVLHISHIQLPKNVSLAQPIEDSEHDLPIVSIHLPKVVQDAEPESTEENVDQQVDSEQSKDGENE